MIKTPQPTGGRPMLFAELAPDYRTCRCPETVLEHCTMSVKKGVFYVIATPIGNLTDITQRAIAVIGEVDVLYAEDTRHTAKLCMHLGLSPKLRSLHDHNEQDRISEIIEQLNNGLSVGLVSDAGTPLISDPGYKIVAACHEADLPVSPVPGVSSLTAVLSVCGLPTDRFLFNGFLPSKATARRKLLSGLQRATESLVFFESKHRIDESLNDILVVLGDRKICVAREVTKSFETIINGNLSNVRERFADNPDWHKGEFVLVVSGAGEVEGQLNEEVGNLLIDLADLIAPKQAAKLVAKHSGVKTKELYDWLLEQK